MLRRALVVAAVALTVASATPAQAAPCCDAQICPVLALLQGTYGHRYWDPDQGRWIVVEVTINGEGDVWVADAPFWDCPPYAG